MRPISAALLLLAAPFVGPGADIEAAEVVRADFDAIPPGPYSLSEAKTEWQSASTGVRVENWSDGLDEAGGRARVFEGDSAWSGRSLRVVYPAGGVGPGAGGAQWRLHFAGRDTMYMRYRVRFAPGHDFVKGGKLPGLCGSQCNTGGNKPTGTDGWSARLMWRENGKVVQYLYYPDQPGTYAVDLPFDIGGQRFFQPGRWHEIQTQIVLNTPAATGEGARDGILRSWFDGELALVKTGLRFRDRDTMHVDGFYFSTFYGGSGAEWASPKDNAADFDDFVVSTDPIGSTPPPLALAPRAGAPEMRRIVLRGGTLRLDAAIPAAAAIEILDLAGRPLARGTLAAGDPAASIPGFAAPKGVGILLCRLRTDDGIRGGRVLVVP